MTNHITIQANGKPLSLPEKFSLDLEYKNPLFNDAESYSYPAEIPLDGNRHFVKNIEDRRSPLRPTSVENTKARIYAEGLPVFDGKIKVGDGEELTSSLSLNVEGGNTLRDLIADLDCKDIPVKDTLIIGQKIKSVKADFSGTYRMDIYQDGADLFFRHYNRTGKIDMVPQALGFSKQMNINTDKPYPAMPYCNARVCYKHYGKNEDGTTSDSVEFGDYGPYFVLDADRQQSGMCFYVLYFLDCLFDYLGVEWDNSALMQIEDLTRLCFFTTKCSYDEKNEMPAPPSNPEEEEQFFEGIDSLNEQLKAWNSGAQFELKADASQINSVGVSSEAVLFHIEGGGYRPVSNESHLNSFTRFSIGEYVEAEFNKLYMMLGFNAIEIPNAKIGMKPESIYDSWEEVTWKEVKWKTCDMVANSGCFPEESVSTILDSLENMFGIRFIYDAEAKKVTARLIRDMFRSDVPVRDFRGIINSMNKISETTTGVYIGYSAESDDKDQRNNLRDKIRDYDTSFDYVDYPHPTANGQRGTSLASTTKISEGAYAQIVGHATNTDNTLYVDSLTGNRYRTKVDKDASTPSELKPVWFQVAQFKGVAFGDCSKANEENVERITTDFMPVILSDVNADNVKQNCANGTPASQELRFQPLLVPFCDEDMEHEYVTQYLDYPFDTEGNVYLRAVLNLQENYDVSSGDSGNSPLQSYDWDLTIAIMRGGGSDATIQSFDRNFDGFNNSRYRTVSGNYALTADTMDMLGNEYDYNGVEPGLGRGERFSLFPRAYATPDWAPDGIYTDPDGKQIPLCRADVHTEVKSAEFGTRIDHTYYRSRGWVDRFLYDYAEWILSRRKFLIRAQCSVAMISDIRNHWFDHWLINGERGIINQVNATIDNATGLHELEIEFFTL